VVSTDDEWRWLDEVQGIGYCYCLMAVQDVGVTDVLSALGATFESVALRNSDDLADWLDDEGLSLDSPIVRAVRTDHRTVTVETNSYRGSQPDVLEALSRNGRAVSYLLMPGNIEWFCLYESGSLITGFESPLQRQGNDPDRLLAAMIRLGLPADGTTGSWAPGYGRTVVNLLRDEFGISITNDHFSAALLTGIVSDQPEGTAPSTQ
jgi:hypothetical protein